MGQAERLGIQHSTVEQQALEWGEKRLIDTFQTRGPRGGIVRVTSRETSETVLRLPALVKLDKRHGAIRYDDVTGEVLVPSWHELPTSLDGQRRFLKEAENYVDLNSKYVARNIDLANLPNRKVGELRLARCSDIEKAIRLARHVREAYSSGDEAGQLDIIFNTINDAWGKVLKRKVTLENLEELATQTASVLHQNGLTRAEKQAKEKIFKRLSDVFKKDSLGRLNSLVQRTRLRSAYLTAIELEAFSVLVGRKYLEVEGILMMEDEISRQSIADARDALNMIMGFDCRGAWVFEGGKPQKGEPKGLETALFGVVLLVNRSRLPHICRLPEPPGLPFGAADLNMLN